MRSMWGRANLLALRARPHAALADLVYVGDVHLAPLGNALYEIPIGLMERFLDVCLLGRREILLVREQCGIVAGGDGIRAQAKEIVSDCPLVSTKAVGPLTKVTV